MRRSLFRPRALDICARFFNGNMMVAFKTGDYKQQVIFIGGQWADRWVFGYREILGELRFCQEVQAEPVSRALSCSCRDDDVAKWKKVEMVLEAYGSDANSILQLTTSKRTVTERQRAILEEFEKEQLDENNRSGAGSWDMDFDKIFSTCLLL
ncbi:uncharacterized protein LOC130996689 [Salvia miltiorrhiza]|uniref:uncharacterized protein LOC130996689 n=1 Tax=Salvia miltiorrhiza TaxID=226208 RepID=UPI0025AC1A10|nr:uncharacterized protein LOC130996689 [Salvia miltiorrhiza]